VKRNPPKVSDHSTSGLGILVLIDQEADINREHLFCSASSGDCFGIDLNCGLDFVSAGGQKALCDRDNQ